MANDGDTSHASAGASGYVYADLEELDEIIGGWQTQSDDVRVDVDLLRQAFHSLDPGASDDVTTQYCDALAKTLNEFYRHTSEMDAYIIHHAAKLAASRQLMTIAEDGNAARFTRGEDV